MRIRRCCTTAKPGTGLELVAGMTFTIEPMINAGRRDVRLLPDGWTVVTKDQSLSAQWEHTILVTDSGFEVLTLGAARRAARCGRGGFLNARGKILEQAADWAYLTAVPEALEGGQFSPLVFRQVLDRGSELLKERFVADDAIEDLVRDRARLVDIALRAAWVRHAGKFAEDLALVAVGGYGRGELHPSSDIDIMVLLPKSDSADWQSDIEKFLTFLWDIGLEVGHSVRSIDDCQRESLADISVATTLFEARLLAGPESLFAGMRRALAPDRLWSSQDFFEAKVKEQTERHHRYFDTAYNLEPNVKSSPGGLRDIQTIGWVAKRHFGTDTLDELVAHGFLTREELRKLKAGQSFLWKVRFGLHVLTGRREDRLLFDYQIKLAKLFGYEDASFTLAVEQLMQKYYRTVMDVSLLNEMLLQLFREAILTQSGPPVPINPRFQIRNDYLEVTHPEVFARYPSALLELFVLLQQHPELRGVRAETIRLIGTHVWLIDEEFRQNPRHHRLFMEILCAPVGVTHELRRMNLYGVLGRYIPSFGRVVGRMQYDLFHAYTVDAHTLFVVSNLRRFAMPKFNDEFPALSQIMQSLPRQELAYLAALFHDIAKGRGGDHSELGAVDAEAFCLEQGLGRYEARLVAWLVRNHLILSITSQKKDISDPDIIHDFARRVGDQAHLDYLYVLTVADVRGTNPKLWNAWKARLFEEFYERTKRALRRGLETPVDQDELIRETQAQARARMPGIDAEADHAGLVAMDRGVLPALHARRDRLADHRARRPPSLRRRPARRDSTTGGARRHRGAHLYAASAAQLRAHHRGARSDGPQCRGRALDHQRQWLQPGNLRGARRQRRGDRRSGPHPRDRARPVAQLCSSPRIRR